MSTNPYDPPSPESMAGATGRVAPKPIVSGTEVVINGVAGVTLSGGIFGFGIGVLQLMFLESEVGFRSLSFPLMTFLFGVIAGGVVSLFVVPVVFGFFIGLGVLGTRKQWTPNQISRFGGWCGFVSGFLAVTPLLVSQSPLVLIVCLLAGGVGFVGTRVVMRPLIKMAKKNHAKLEAELFGDSTSTLSV